MARRHLFGPVSPRFVEQNLYRHCQSGDCLAFDATGATSFAIGMADTWDGIAARWPAGWQPDFAVLDLHYTMIPPCLWQAPVPLIGLAQDWNLLWHAYRRLLHHVDLVLTDTGGVEHVAREGIRHAWAANLFGLERQFLADPEKGTGGNRENRASPFPPFPPVHHGHLTESDNQRAAAGARDIDILFVGNLHPAVQRERLPWLARVAQLSERRRVAILQGVFDEEYRRLLGRARIVFNRSLRGECNMRALEAAASGALLFQEAGNLEIPAYLRDRQECVYYSDESLEELLDYYLDHEDERRAIAEAGRQRVQQYSFANLWDEQLRRIEEAWPELEERCLGRRHTNPKRERGDELPRWRVGLRCAEERGDELPRWRVGLRCAEERGGGFPRSRARASG